MKPNAAVDKRIKAAGIAALALILLLSGGIAFLVIDRNATAAKAQEQELRLEEQGRRRDFALANVLFVAGEHQLALDILNRLLEEEPGNPAFLALRDRITADRLFAAGEFQQAMNIIERLLADDPANEDYLALKSKIQKELDKLQASAEPSQEEIEARLQREAAAARRRAQQEELARVSRELQDQMRTVNDLVSQGLSLLERGDFPGADRAFAEARSRMPANQARFEAQKLAEIADAWYGAFARSPDSPAGAEAASKAASFARESIAKDPQALPHFVLGKISRDRREWDSAIASFREAARLDTSNYVYPYELGRGYFSVRNYADARGAFESSVRINPRFETGWYNLGGTLRLLNRQDEALNAYRRAIAVKADYALAHREIGRILFARKDYRGAQEAFASALRHNPGDIASLRELGAAQSEAGNYGAAEESFARALQSAPADGQTNYNMAVVKLALKKNAEALSFARHAFDSNPSSAVYAYTVGLALEAMGETEPAADAYRRASLMDTQYARPRINLGKLFIERDNYNEAIRCLNEAYGIEPGNFEVNNNLGAVYAKMENWSSSVRHYERALAADSKNPTVHLNLARACTSAGDLAKARNSYQAALQLSPDNWDALFELGKICVSLGMPDDARRYLGDLLRRNASYAGKAEAERILAGL